MLSRWAVLPFVGLAILLGHFAAAGPGLGDDAKKAKSSPAVKKAGPEQRPKAAKSAVKAGGDKRPAAEGKPSGPVAKPALPSSVCSPEAIRRALDRPAELDFVETPLADVVDFLRSYLQVPICLDTKALTDVGIAADTPVTISIRSVSVRTALTLMLRNLDLRWTVFGEVLLITAPEQAESLLETVVYDVHDLVVGQDEKGKPAIDFDSLIGLITCTIEPTTWDSVGGPGSIAPFEGNGIATMVVSQTWQTHEKIARILAELRNASHAKPGETARPRTIRPLKRAEAKARDSGGAPAGGPAPSAEKAAPATEQPKP